MKLDDHPADLFRADFGLTATLIPEGKHVITLEYTPPGPALGWAATAGAIAGLLSNSCVEVAGGEGVRIIHDCHRPHYACVPETQR